MLPLIASLLARIAPGVLARLAPAAALEATTAAGAPALAATGAGVLSKVGPTALSKLKGLGSLAGGAAGVALPLILQLIGGGTKGLADAAGAGIAGVSKIPGALAGTQQAKKELYGATPLDKAGEAVEAIGQAAGGAVAGVGNAVGDTLTGIGNTSRLMNLQRELHALDTARLTELERLGLSPSTANLYSRMLQERGSATK